MNHPRVHGLLRRLQASGPTTIGFPVAIDGDYRPFAPLLGYLLNNVGDPDSGSLYAAHTKDFERETIGFLARLFRAPEDRFGYVTSGGTEGTLYALYLARTRHRGGIVYRSEAAHYSVAKAAHLLNMDDVVVAASPHGEIDYDDLARRCSRHSNRPAIVVANIGTTMTEAIDDVGRIHAALDDARVPGRYVHADAALAGIPLALTKSRPAFDFADGADSISVSGHKFLGTPIPCGAVIALRHHTDRLIQAVAYIGSVDSTITGSRSGLAALMMWTALHHYGHQGLHARARQGRDLAAYTCQRLTDMGWAAWRNPHAFTVVLRTPPPAVAARWPLPTEGTWSHLVCMPGIARLQIDAFLDDLESARHRPDVVRGTARGAAS